MFEDLRQHRKILVTGPHRSGTTIAATMIAKDTGHTLVLEEDCHLPSQDLALLNFCLNEQEAPCVLQAPFVADQCHVYKDALVVFMHRSLEDIKASQNRMFLKDGSRAGWEALQIVETRKYNTGQLGKPIAMIKYENWQYQKEVLPHYLELEHDSLCDHPLWVPKEQRKQFHVRQTEKIHGVC